ncbi:unnamed protein product [Symbiodinium sp. CCMP2592]|nr:unnamed protein product [Symbiodinium sp. CCMP2592]
MANVDANDLIPGQLAHRLRALTQDPRPAQEKEQELMIKRWWNNGKKLEFIRACEQEALCGQYTCTCELGYINDLHGGMLEFLIRQDLEEIFGMAVQDCRVIRKNYYLVLRIAVQWHTPPGSELM